MTGTETAVSMISHAYRYAAMGWLVFPIREAGEAYKDKDGVEKIAEGKEPGTANGFKQAAADPAQIGKWWNSKPRRGMAIRTCKASGIWTLDSDGGGEETIARLEAEFGALPKCPMQKTPSGGIHRIFAWPDDGIDLPRKIRFLKRTEYDLNGNGGGLDALGERNGERGGYFVVAPSERADGRYEWLVSPDDCEPPQAPRWLVSLVRTASETERNPNQPVTKPVKTGKNNAYGEKILREETDRVRTLPFGQQNEVFYQRCVRVGSIAYGGSLDVGYALESMIAAGMGMQNQPGKRPWVEAEIRSLAMRGFAYGSQDPNAPPHREQVRHQYVPDDVEYDPETGEILHEGNPDLDVTENPPETESKPKKAAGRSSDEPFQCIGYNRGHYYYLPRGTGQVTALRPSEHSPNNLVALASLEYWQGQNDGAKPDKGAWLGFANSMMRKCEQMGIFDEGRIRGRGAWIDGGRTIVNTGGEAHVDGVTLALNKLASRFIYEAGEHWDFGFSEPADSKAAHRIVNICERLTWEDPLSGALMAGWSVIAPVSGALKWRSHIWITGPSGAGKSTALDIMKRVVGPSAENVDGKVTEAAIRQLMGFDARPVLFDESEGEDQAGAQRMQQILELARAASSGARIPKGGANGVAKIYLMRSAFCFSSINTSVRQRADENRISKLVLKPNTAHDADKHYTALVRDVTEWLTPEFAGAMFARTTKNLPTLLKNVETFTAAAAAIFKSRRAADQIGPMLAGYYLCHSTAVITIEKAMEFIGRHKWGEFVAIDGENDEMQMLQYIVTRPLRVQLAAGPLETTIGAGLEALMTDVKLDSPYKLALGMRGIKLDGEFFAVSESAENTREIFKNMPKWQSDWKRTVRMIPGAVRGDKVERFPGGIVSRVTWIPVAHLFGTYREREVGEEG